MPQSFRPVAQQRHDFVVPCVDVWTQTYRAWIARGRGEVFARQRAAQALAACRAGLPTAAPNAAAPVVLPPATLGDYPTYPAVDVPAVPTQRLEHYLDFWESERDAARSDQSPAWASTPYHAERDINVPVPQPWFFAPGGRNFLSFAGVETESRELAAWAAGSGMRAVGQPIGEDPTALVNRQSSTVFVSATWAQRAVNGWRATLGSPPIQVDGAVGPATIGALRLAQLSWWARFSNSAVQSDTGQTSIGSYPMPTRSGSGAALTVPLYDFLKQQVQVADPPRAQVPPPPTTTTTTTDTSTEPSGSAGTAGFFLLAALGIGVFAFSRR